MLDLIKVIILGIVEGVTEFLPISSTGHLIVALAVLQPGFSEAMSKTFEIFIQIGAIVAVIAFYRADIWRQVTTVTRDRRIQHFWIAIVVGFVPIGAVGFLARDFIDQVLQDNPVLVAVTLILGGIVFIVFEHFWSREKAQSVSNEALYDVTFGQALFIGVVQIVAIVPGVSRAAASILGGMVAGLDRATATKFSFYLAIPTLGIATVFKLLISMSGLQGSDYVYLLIGAIVSGIIAWFAIGWLLRYIAQHTFTSFGYYRIAAGIVILLLVAASII